MEKYYLINEDISNVDENDIIYFEMPPMCSGEYDAKVFKDEKGLFINKTDNYFQSCYDFRINKSYWN